MDLVTYLAHILESENKNVILRKQFRHTAAMQRIFQENALKISAFFRWVIWQGYFMTLANAKQNFRIIY